MASFQAQQPERGTEGFDSIESLPALSSGSQIFRYPQTLGQAAEYRSYMGFDIFDSAGHSLDTNQISNQGKVAPAAEEGGFFSTIGSALSTSYNWVTTTAKDLQIGEQFASMQANITTNTNGAGAQMNTITGSGYTQERTGLGVTNKKMPESIYLYMPSNISTNYGAEYTQADFSGYVGAMDAISGLGQMATGEGTEGIKSGILKTAARGYMEKGSAMMKDSGVGKYTGGDVDVKAVAEASTRNVANPMMINMFKSVSRRTFEFSYSFMPISPEETDQIYNIIKIFKKYSMPKRTDGGRFVDFPAEFLITFYYNGNINTYLPKIFKCACTSVDVTYGGEAGPFVVFKTPGDKGSPPVSLKLALKFTETQILTREEIEAGY